MIRRLPRGEIFVSADLVTVARFSDPVEAELARSRLIDEGLSAVVTGDVAGVMFGMSYSTGGLDLLVSAEHKERAVALLADLAKEIEAQKDAPKEAINTDPTRPAFQDEPPTLEELAAQPNSAEQLVERAFRASLFGYLLICWPLIHLYAMFLLLKVTFGDEELRGKHATRYYAAFILSAISLAFGALLVLGFLASGD